MNTPKTNLVKAVFLNFIVLNFAAVAIAKPKNTPELLVAGDSWANFLCDDRGYQKIFDHLGVKNLKEHSDCKSTSKNGLEAGEWMQTDQHKRLLGKLNNRSAIKYVHLSIGGNDLIARWNVAMNIEQEIELFERNYSLIQSIVESLLAKKNTVKVILSGYDYPRFTPDHPIVEFQQILYNMGNPTPLELNSALVRYHQYLHRRFLSHEAYQKNIFTIHHLGLGQFYHGGHGDGLQPGQTLHPDFISTLDNPEAVGGDQRYMTDKKAMKKWFAGIYDAFHIGESGNKRLAEHVYKNIIQHQ